MYRSGFYADRLGNSDLFGVALFIFVRVSERKIIVNFEQWNGFTDGEWQEKINVRDFIDKNYTP
ncbi:MAG: hypothetical protein KBS41_03395, partial [Oscillospiraceae bacterium]|nr:hypothetical protein [Candidatus Equicaccousia limihippi]